MEEINKQILLLISNLSDITIASHNFIENDNLENINILAGIVKQSEKEFDTLKQMLADMIENKDSIVEVTETENGFEVK
jgi:hypothetical protein